MRWAGKVSDCRHNKRQMSPAINVSTVACSVITSEQKRLQQWTLSYHYWYTKAVTVGEMIYAQIQEGACFTCAFFHRIGKRGVIFDLNLKGMQG